MFTFHDGMKILTSQWLATMMTYKTNALDKKNLKYVERKIENKLKSFFLHLAKF